MIKVPIFPPVDQMTNEELRKYAKSLHFALDEWFRKVQLGVNNNETNIYNVTNENAGLPSLTAASENDVLAVDDAGGVEWKQGMPDLDADKYLYNTGGAVSWRTVSAGMSQPSDMVAYVPGANYKYTMDNDDLDTWHVNRGTGSRAEVFILPPSAPEGSAIGFASVEGTTDHWYIRVSAHASKKIYMPFTNSVSSCPTETGTSADLDDDEEYLYVWKAATRGTFVIISDGDGNWETLSISGLIKTQFGNQVDESLFGSPP